MLVYENICEEGKEKSIIDVWIIILKTFMDGKIFQYLNDSTSKKCMMSFLEWKYFTIYKQL